MAENKLADISTEFAIQTLKLTDGMKGYRALTNQLERSGTSIGANIREAKYAHSKGERQMIRQATKVDIQAVAQLAAKMWTEPTVNELAEEFEAALIDENATIFLCIVDKRTVGFAQCQLRRDYVEGASTSPVGYLEGVFVETEYRSRGYAKDLLSACEQWAKERGCTEFASDCELDNDQSLAFHLHAGFTEVNRIICFAKKI